MPPPRITTRTGRSAARVQSDPGDRRTLLVDHLAPVDVTLDPLAEGLVDAAVDQHGTGAARTGHMEGDDPSIEWPPEALADQVPRDQVRHPTADTLHGHPVAFVAEDGPVLATPDLEQRHHARSPPPVVGILKGVGKGADAAGDGAVPVHREQSDGQQVVNPAWVP